MTRLDDDAQALLEEAGGDAEKARTSYIGYSLLYLQEEMPDLYDAIKTDPSRPDCHAVLVEVTFDAIAAFLPLTHTAMPDPATAQRLTAIARAAVPLDGSARLLDVGCGSGVLLPYAAACGAPPADYRGIDLSNRMIELAREAAGSSGARFDDVGFDAAVAEGQTYESVVFHNSLQYFANQAAALTSAAALLEGESSRIVISHLAGAKAVRQERVDNPTTVLSEMPSLAELQGLVAGLGLQVVLPSFFGSDSEQIQAGLDGFYLVILRRAGGDAAAEQAAVDRPFDALLDTIEASLPPL